MAESVVRQPETGDAFWMLGGLYEVKASSEETGGAMTVMEMLLPPGMGPPPHTHPGDESVYVIEGHLRYHIAGQTHEGGAGAFFYIPAGTVENFEPVGDAPSRILVVYTPGGVEKFFAEAGERAPARELPPPPSEPPDMAKMAEIASRYGMDIQLPEAASA
jgi:quercetin dioxygenase-like cupin family protein